MWMLRGRDLSSAARRSSSSRERRRKRKTVQVAMTSPS